METPTPRRIRHDPTRPRMRKITKQCACGADVTFHVWRGFAKIAEHLATHCTWCHNIVFLRDVSIEAY